MMRSDKAMKTLIQCDFDGTVTEMDVSFLLLDAFTDGSWKQLFAQYQEGRISVNSFNSRAFAMVKEDKRTLLQFAHGKVRVRDGFLDLVDYCRQKDFRFVVVSNGMEFYIEAVLRDIGLGDIEVFAAQAEFDTGGIKTQYIGPDGNPLEDSFKEVYARSFIEEGYRIVYVGNGFSDLAPARLAHHVFATDGLLKHCELEDLNCAPFGDFNDVVRGLGHLPLE